MVRLSLLISTLLFIQISSATQVDAGGPEESCIKSKSDILDKLNCLNGFTATEVTSPTSGVRQFELTVSQPVDHSSPTSDSFLQRVALLHRGENEPVVLQTSGYSIFAVRDTHLSRLFKTNQIQIEHRYFSNSKPTVLDWTHLNIKQSADDFHRITVSLKKIYAQPWVNTGASKGGMTSVYHRRFYPDDVVGTVADVAPLSYTRNDQRYIEFLNNVGGAAYEECRKQFKSVQYDVLKNRNEFLPKINGQFQQLGDKNVAFEHAVIESAFYFWQYGNPDDSATGCATLPTLLTLDQKFNFISSLASLADYEDSSIEQFMPYYYQAATQLGSPDTPTAHLETLRLFEFKIDQYTPKGIPLHYSNAAMVDVEKWLKTDADQIIFVYGEFDPWTAGEMPVSETGKFVRKYYAPKANHGAKFVLLNPSDKNDVIQVLSQWFQKAPAAPVDALKLKKGSSFYRETLDDIELSARKKFKL